MKGFRRLSWAPGIPSNTSKKAFCGLKKAFRGLKKAFQNLQKILWQTFLGLRYVEKMNEKNEDKN